MRGKMAEFRGGARAIFTIPINYQKAKIANSEYIFKVRASRAGNLSPEHDMANTKNTGAAKRSGARKLSTRRAQMSTDLERHVNAPGRAALVKQVREKIKRLGITYIYFQFVSVTGASSARAFRPITGSASPSAAFNWSTAPPPTCS